MEMAIEEMRKSRSEHTEKEDPLVGAVVVTASGEEYKTHRASLREGDHAEEALLERLLHNKDVHGSTLYVTLEPCSSRASRIPCVQLISYARVGRAFIGMPDPNPDIEGHGVAYLRKKHVEVHFFDDDLALQIEQENQHFIEFWKRKPIAPGGPLEELQVPSQEERRAIPRAHVGTLSHDVIQTYVNNTELPYRVPSTELWEHFKDRGLLASSPEGDVATVGGLILFGNKPELFLPQCKIKADSFSGTFDDGTLAETVRGGGQRDITGPLVRTVDEVEDFFRRQVEVVPHFEGSSRVMNTEYPWFAVREAIVNALVHRDYAKPAHVILQIFRDRIVVKSPGLMVRPNSPEKIRTRAVVPARRNEQIAAAVFALGYMEERGNGFERIAKYLRAYGLRAADYKEEAGFFVVTLYGRALTPLSRRLTPEVKAQLTKRQLELLELLAKRGRISSEEHQRRFDITRETANQDFRKLVGLGLIERRGRGRSIHYVLSGM
jgi:predicted HTH transcriptional regulator/pyrimidine deaminase RibD-like protein